MSSEARFAILTRTHPELAERLLLQAQADVDERWRYYTQLAAIERKAPLSADTDPEGADEAEGRDEEEGA